MRFFAYLAACTLVLVLGLALDGLDISIGGWIALAGLAGLMPVYIFPPEPRDMPVLIGLVLVVLPVVLVVDALDGPEWIAVAWALLCLAGWMWLKIRRDEGASGMLRIPAGLRFRDRD